MDCPQTYQHKPKVCVDKSWICFFGIFWCFLIVIIASSIVYGNYPAIINGADSYGNICNQKHNKHYENFNLSARDTSRKPFLFYFDIEDYDNVMRICVEKCPVGTQHGLYGLVIFYDRHASHLCAYDMDILKEIRAHPNYEKLKTRRGPCPLMAANSKPYRNRCVYASASYLVEDFYINVLNSGGLDQLFFVSVYQAWHYVAFMCGFAFAISLIILALMSWLTKVIAWIICLLLIVTSTTLCTKLWQIYDDFPPFKEDVDNGEDIEYEDEMKFEIILHFLEEFRVHNFIIYWLAILTALITITLIILTLILIKYLSRTKLLFDEAVVCIKQLSGISVVLNIALISMILFILLSAYTMLCLTTAQYPVVKSTREPFNILGEEDPLQHFKLFYQIVYVDAKIIRKTFWIYIIGFLWTTEFIFAFEEFCIGAAVAFWYFKPSVYKPSRHALEVLVKYHLGTIAKGSAVITLFKIPRWLLVFILRIVKKMVKHRWFQHFEEQIGLWNHNAYAPAAMETTDFHSAGKVAWKIFSQNAEQIESINIVFDIVMFLSKLLVATITCLFGITILKDGRDYLIMKDKEEFFFYIAPVLFGTFCAFLIAHIVFSVIEITVDTLLLCACEDQLIYGGLRRAIKCNLGKLFTKIEENSIQVIKLDKIQKQPFQKVRKLED